MELKVKRRYKGEKYTIGDFFIDGVKICDTLEDTDRGLKQTDSIEHIKSVKIYGETAIPTGRYKVIINKSPKFGRDLPRLIDVPGYEGILIHAGNTAKDTYGCILPGFNTLVGKVTHSRHCESEIISRIKNESEIWITIE